jgi:biotin carboxylase
MDILQDILVNVEREFSNSRNKDENKITEIAQNNAVTLTYSQMLNILATHPEWVKREPGNFYVLEENRQLEVASITIAYLIEGICIDMIEEHLELLYGFRSEVSQNISPSQEEAQWIILQLQEHMPTWFETEPRTMETLLRKRKEQTAFTITIDQMVRALIDEESAMGTKENTLPVHK